MGAAVPIIAVVASVAGTAASISAQNRAASQQNRMIDAQISANRDAERIRQRANQTQLELLAQQHHLQNAAIQDNMRKERNDLITQRLGILNQARQQQMSNVLQQQATALEIQAGQQAVVTQQRDLESGLKDAETQSIGQAAAAVAQLGDPSRELTDLSRQVRANSAQIRAFTGSRGASSQLQKTLNPEQIQEAARILQEQRGLTAEAAQAIAASKEFSDITRSMAEAQLAQQMAMLNRADANMRVNSGIQSRMITAQRNQGTRQTDTAIRANQISERQQINQSDVNAALAAGSLITGNQLGVAQAAAQSAQLEAQRQSGPPPLASIAQLTQALLPAGQLLGSGNVQSRYPQYPSWTDSYGMVTNPSNLPGSSPKNFSSLQPNVLQAITQPKVFNPSMASQVPVVYKNWGAR